jgi:hypothetical protein
MVVDRMSKLELLSVLEFFDDKLKKKIKIIMVGGTAMTLLGIKASTKDIDFNIPDKDDYKEFKILYEKIRPGVIIDFYGSNMVFSEVLPEDYIKKVSTYKTDLKNIEILILSPIDIICSKISRSNESDIEDIRECIQNFNIKKEEIIKRARMYERAGNDKAFKTNLKILIDTLFD